LRAENWNEAVKPVDKDWGIQYFVYTGPGTPVGVRYIPLHPQATPNNTKSKAQPKPSATQPVKADPKTEELFSPPPSPPKDTGK
jgi:hypothetical protein